MGWSRGLTSGPLGQTHHPSELKNLEFGATADPIRRHSTTIAWHTFLSRGDVALQCLAEEGDLKELGGLAEREEIDKAVQECFHTEFVKFKNVVHAKLAAAPAAKKAKTKGGAASSSSTRAPPLLVDGILAQVRVGPSHHAGSGWLKAVWQELLGATEWFSNWSPE